MFRNSQNASQTSLKSNRFGNARKWLLGIGGVAVAGIMMAAAPAQAGERHEDHGRFERHEIRRDVVIRHDVVVAPPVYVSVASAPVVCAPVVAAPVQIWVPDRYEIRTCRILGCKITERVLVEPGHWALQ